MGAFTIVILGVGTHHNSTEQENHPNDAEKMAKQFVEDLRTKGHSIEHASITTFNGRELL